MSATEKDWPRAQLIYIGDRLDTGKLSAGFILLPEGGASAEEARGLPKRWWTLKGASRRSVNLLPPGAVISVEAQIKDDGISVRFGTLRTVQARWDDPESVLRWTAEHRADRAEAERRKSMKDRDALREALDPIRDLYVNLRGRHRTALLAEVVRYITS